MKYKAEGIDLSPLYKVYRNMCTLVLLATRIRTACVSNY